ncbi:MAG: F0F1 ATP synthase subunit A [Bacteroidales bacterium]
MNNLKKGLISIAISGLLFHPGILMASGEASEADTLAKEEKFKPGPFILDHIGDAYFWHILHYKNKAGHEVQWAIPLPVIVYSSEKGLNIFISSHFEHGHAAYKGFHIAEAGPHKGKVVETLGDGTEVVPLDLSITKNVFSLFVSFALLLWIFIGIARRYTQNPNTAPRGLQSWIEPLILFIRDDVARPMIGEKRYERYMPYLLTLFFFIFLNNLMGLVPIFPGGANVTGNIAVTMVMALFTFFITNFSGNRDYWVHMVNMPGVPWWLKIPIPLMPIIEILQVFLKPFVLTIRLFANMTAGHIIPLAFISLIFIFAEMHPLIGYGVSIVSVLFSVFMGLLELLVAFIQAYVFTLLSALYFGMATAEHSHAEEHHK